MRTTDEASLVIAAQAGDPRAVEELVTAYLPVVYTVVRRALGGHPDVDDVVQETMLRCLGEFRALRTPASFRPWLLAIAMRQIGTYLRRSHAVAARTASIEELAGMPEPGPEGEALLRADLSEQRRQVVRASNWLDPADRALLSLWWLESAGKLTRNELAAALGMSTAHAAVRVQRMRQRLELARSLAAALDVRPRCARLDAILAGWDGSPSPLSRKRIARHLRSCPACSRAGAGTLALERLLPALALLPVPVALSAAVLGKSPLAGTLVGGASAVGAPLGGSAAGAPLGGSAAGMVLGGASAAGAPLGGSAAGTVLGGASAVGAPLGGSAAGPPLGGSAAAGSWTALSGAGG